MADSRIPSRFSRSKGDSPGLSGRGLRFREKMTCDEGDDGVKRINGDGLSLRMDSNHRVLVVTGDGCTITVARNSGSVRVVGDGCRLKVLHNAGDIVYNGDGGRVLLGPNSCKERVKYVGHGGKVSFHAEPGEGAAKGRGKSASGAACNVRGSEGVVGEENSPGRTGGGRNSGEKVVEEGKHGSDRTDDRAHDHDTANEFRHRPTDQDQLDPERIEGRSDEGTKMVGKEEEEGSRRACGRCDENDGRRKRTVVVVTKIITKPETSGRPVKKWLVKPVSVIRPIHE